MKRAGWLGIHKVFCSYKFFMLMLIMFLKIDLNNTMTAINIFIFLFYVGPTKIEKICQQYIEKLKDVLK